MSSSVSDKRVGHDQAFSLAARLKDAKILHDDTADIELIGVGANVTDREVVLYFCPAEISAITAHCRSTSHERKKDLPDRCSFTPNAERHLRKQVTKRGFVRLSARVHPNGLITLSYVKVHEILPVAKDVDVHHRHAYRQYLQALADQSDLPERQASAAW